LVRILKIRLERPSEIEMVLLNVAILSSENLGPVSMSDWQADKIDIKVVFAFSLVDINLIFQNKHIAIVQRSTNVQYISIFKYPRTAYLIFLNSLNIWYQINTIYVIKSSSLKIFSNLLNNSPLNFQASHSARPQSKGGFKIGVIREV